MFLRAPLKTCVVIVLSLAFSSCIETYKPSASSSLKSYRPSNRGDAIYYFYSRQERDRGDIAEPELSMESMILFAAFDRIAKPVLASDPPAKGLYVYVSKTPKIPSTWARACSLLHSIMLSAFPCYTRTAGFHISYDLYLDKEQKATYHYEISREGVDWIGLLPFVWVNAFTMPYREAFRTTVYQFTFDAERDGFLD